MVVKVLERDLERHFAKECKRLKLTSIKLALRFSTGWPDRLVILNDGRCLWIELKTLTGVVSLMQSIKHEQLEELGHTVLVLRTKEEITDALVAACIPAKCS